MLRRMVCEVRYQDGQLYLDHCGRLLKKLLKDSPEWVVTPDPTPQGTAVFNIVVGTQLGFSLNAASLNFDKTVGDEVIKQDGVELFCKQVRSVLEMTLDEIEVSEITRVGYREQYYFSFDSKEESENWIQGLGLFTVVPGFMESFKSQMEACGVSLVLQGQDCQYRVAVNGIERHAQIPVGDVSINIHASKVSKGQEKALREALKQQRQRQINSAFAVALDIDAYLLDPVEPDIADFVKERNSTNLDLFRNGLPKEPGKKGK